MVAIGSGSGLRRALAAVVVAAVPWLAGCGTTSLVLGAAGIATDTSMTWDIVKHLHGLATDGDPAPCAQLDSVQRALNPRCGPFRPGSLTARDVRGAALQECVLATVLRDPRLWPALPELLDRGAQPEACARSPLAELAQLPGCPDFAAATPPVLRSLEWLALADSRAVTHDTVRVFSCPSARRAGLDAVLMQWLARGDLDRGTVGFGPLGALHPDYLDSPLAQALEARGHTAREGLGGHAGAQPGGFELALRENHRPALEWWLQRAPQLANRVPPSQGNQLPWVPLARVLVPNFLDDASNQRDLVEFLLSRGADPWQKLPFDSNRSVVQYARTLHSPMVDLLDPPVRPVTVVAHTSPLTQ